MVRRRRLADTLIAASGVGCVIVGIAIVSVDARTVIGNAILNDPGELNAVALRVQSMGHDFYRAAAAYRADNGPMVGFAVFALILTFLMFRT